MENNGSPVDFLVVASGDERLHPVEKMLQERGGNEVLRVSFVNEARQVLREGRVQFVITQFDLPGMNGIELIKMVRRVPALFEIPVLLFIAQSQKVYLSQAIEEGVDGCLLEPFGADELLGAIKKILAERSEQSSEQRKLKAAKKLLLYKKYDGAIAAAQEILTKGENGEAYLIISEAYYWLKHYDRAEKYLRRLMQKEKVPDSRTLHLLSKVSRAENQCGDTINYLLKAIAKSPQNLDLKIDLGKLYLDFEMGDRADAIFQEVFDSRPSDLHLIKAGKAYLRKGELDKAGFYLDRTVRPIPETVYIFYQYALALAGQDRYEESAVQLKKCLHIVPKDVSFPLALGEMLLKMGQKSGAARVYKYILQLEPGQKKAKTVLDFLRDRQLTS